ncbi:hypothetical protein EZS27_015738 [termite gut metagenome]|uniref:Uncharacterized protein n=1 Tax=termite gut metagenome TaxID=433724 RepID=A0A5J4RQV1_9ZZZZ
MDYYGNSKSLAIFALIKLLFDYCAKLGKSTRLAHF